MSGTLQFLTYPLNNLAAEEAIVAGTFSVYAVPVDVLDATQLNVGYTEVDTKAQAYDQITSASALQADLEQDVEPVVIGPGGQLYNTDGQHTFLALEDSAWGASDPTVYVNVIANYSTDTAAQFWAQMEASNLLYPVNDGVLQNINLSTGAPDGETLTALSSDVYRGLEYSILKNKLSKLFTTTANIAGITGEATPGLDKTAAFYSDFIWADAYRDANGGYGLPTLTPGDILLATSWNLNGANTTTLPNAGGGYTSYTVAQLPGYILPTGGSITITGTINNATLANGTLDGSATGSFNETTTFASFNGLRVLDLGPVSIGSDVQQGFVLQLGADLGGTVTLSGSNTYTGGTTIIAGTLIITSDASLGAAAVTTTTITPANVTAGVEADNGIIFDSLTEGNGTLQFGATGSAAGSNSFTENRAIAINSEQANLNLNDNNITLTGEIYSTGALSNGLSNAGLGVTGYEAPITVEDLSTGDAGVLTLAAADNNPYFYGDWVVGGASGAGTLSVASDASLGNTTGAADTIGEIDLNGGIFQTYGSFSSVRTVFLSGSSTFDTDGNTSSWAYLQDVQRVLTVLNSSTTAAGAVTFGAMEISATATLDLASATKAVSVTLSNGFVRDTQATVLLEAGTTSGKTNVGNKAVGSANYEVFNTGNGSTNLDGIDSPWIAIATNATSSDPTTFAFANYGSTGYSAATASTTGNTATISSSTGSSTVDLGAGFTASGNLAAYALNLNTYTLALGANTLTLGDGTDPTGLILNGAATAISGTGTIATGGSELVIWAGGASLANTIAPSISGSGGITVTGEGTVTLSAAASETGLVTIDSGTLALTAANVFQGDADGLDLANTKSHPAAASLTFTASQQFSALNSVGNNSAVTWSGAGTSLTFGDANNESSTLSSTLTDSTTNVTGALTKDGSGLLDISGATVSLGSGDTMVVNAGALRIANGVFKTSATNVVSLASGTELQYAGNQGSQLALGIQGAGVFHLIGGTVELTGTNNSYTGGTVLELGATLDLTTANVSTGNANITDAGGLVDFDQNTSGTYSGVISDGFQAGGPNDLNDQVATSGVAEQGSLVKDDSATGGAGNVTLANVQTYTGGTYIEAGTLTLGVANAVADSSGVTLGRTGYLTTSTLALGANNSIAALSSSWGITADAANTTTTNPNGDSLTVSLGSYQLTIAPAGSVVATYQGTITGTGGLVIDGAGTEILDGSSNYSGGTTLEAGTLELAASNASGTGGISFAGSASAELAIAAGDAPSGQITGFTTTDSIDLLGAGTETGFSYNSATGALSLTGGASPVTLDVAALPAGDDFVLSSDGNGGTLITVAPVAAPSITALVGEPVNGSAIEVTGTGTNGDTVTLYADGGTTAVGSGTVENGSFDIVTSATFADGNHTLTATETTADGATSSASNGFVVAVDPNAPSDLILAGHLAGGLVLEVTGTGETVGDDVTLYDGPTEIGTATVGLGGGFTLAAGPALGGAYTLDVTETDGAGLTSQPATVSGNVYFYASPALASSNVVLGNVHTGDADSSALSITNSTSDAAYTEGLDASFGGTTGSATDAGSLSLLAAGDTDNSSLDVGLATGSAGAVSGTVTLDLTSDGAGTSGLGTTALASQTVDVSGAVYAYAGPALASNDITLGNVHVGDADSAALSITNSTTDASYTEGLDASFAGTTGSATDAGSLSLLAAGDTDNASLNVGLATTSAGAVSGTATLDLTSDGAGTSGLGTTALASQTVDVSGAVYAYASPALASSTITLGNVHVGDADSAALSITNSTTDASYTEGLDASFGGTTGGATDAGSLSLLAAGDTDNASLNVGLATGNAGAVSGTATLDLTSDGSGTSGLGTTALAAQTVNVSGAVYAYATPSLASSTINFGVVHVGSSASQALSLADSATNAAYTEGLDASLSGATSGVTAAGSLTDLAAGTSNNTSLLVGLVTTSSGVISGTASLGLTSDGTIDGLGNSVLANQTIDITGTVDNYAVASLAKVAGAGTLTQTGANTYTLNLGSVLKGNAALSANLEALNSATGLADLLGGGFTVTGASSGISNTGLSAFSGLAAGAADTAPVVTLSTSTAGVFTETITLTTAGSNTSGYSGALPTITLTVTGTVAQTFVLTTHADTVNGGPGNNLIVATTNTLSAGDQINGGSPGTNTLELSGGGNFNLSLPATLSNVQIVTAQEATGNAAQTVTLRNGFTGTLNVANGGTGAKITIIGANDSATINLGNGNDTVTVGAATETIVGNGGNDLFNVTAATIGAAITGGSGSNTLAVSGGGTMVMGGNVTGIANVTLDDARVGGTNFTANTTAGLSITAGNGLDTITVGAASQSVIAGNGFDTIDATAALAGAAVTGHSELATTLAITTGGAATLAGSDNNLTVLLGAGANTLTLGAGAKIATIATTGTDTIILGAASQLVIAGSGHDTIDVTAALAGATIAGYGEASTTLAITTSGTATLANGDNNLTVQLGAGTNTLALGNGDDIAVTAGPGTDTVILGDSTQSVTAGSGTVTVDAAASLAAAAVIGNSHATTTLAFTTAGSETLSGADTDLTVQLTAGTNRLALGGGANITVNAGLGTDTITVGNLSQAVAAGSSNDAVNATAALAGVTVVGSSQTATTLNITTAGTEVLNSADSNLTVQLTAGSNNLTLGTLGFITVDGGTSGTETITAKAANQTLVSQGGTDSLVGFSGYGDIFKGTHANLSHDTITNFGGNDLIDITNLNSLGATLSYSATTDQLTVKNGGASAVITFAGSYNAASFSLGSDGASGTYVHFV